MMLSMKLLFTTVVAGFLAQEASAHMGVTNVILPGGQLSSFKSRSQVALGDPYRYPNAGVCHGIDTKGPVHEFFAGDTIRPQMSFGASHNGGHCAWAVSTDQVTWTKLADVQHCTLSKDHALTLPSNLPPACATSGCILSWFWTPVSSGSCEIYQNCFDIKVDVATGGIEQTNPSFTHGKNNEIRCQRVTPPDQWTTNYGALIGSSPTASSPTAPPVIRPAPTPKPTAPPVQVSPTPANDECVTHAQMVAINSESSYWPRCDNSQDIKGSAVGYVFGLYCSREWVTHLNIVLKDLGYCQNRPVIRNFLTQAAYETGYYSTLGQPIDDGSGIIHMIPSNWASNVEDMDALFPTEGLKAEYLSRDAAGRKNFFKEPTYAWKSAAAWFKRTNRNIPGCGKDLFPLSLDEQTKCILGRVVDRTQAYDLVSKHIPLLPVSPTPAVVTQPPSQPPTTPPTRPPTFQFIPPTAAPPTASGGTGSSTGCEGVPAYSNGATYVDGDKAVFENRVYQAKWWTRGEEPNLGGVWALLHWCKTEAGVVDESSRVCGGISEWLSSAIYNGGALVHFKNTVYKAKWWSRGTEPDVADSWSKQSDCAKMEAALPTSTENTKDPALVLGVDNVVNTEADQQASGQPFSVYLSILLDNIQGGKTAKDLEPMEQSLIGVLEVQYGIFVPKNSIKDIVFKQRGPSSVEMIAQLHFPSLHAAEDAQAVMAQYESTVRETIKQIARSYEVEVGDVAVAGSSVVAEGIEVEISASPSALPSSFAIVLTSTLMGYFVRQ